MYPENLEEEEEEFHPPTNEDYADARDGREYVAIRHCSYKSIYARPGDPIPGEFPEEAIEILLKKGAIKPTES